MLLGEYFEAATRLKHLYRAEEFSIAERGLS